MTAIDETPGTSRGELIAGRLRIGSLVLAAAVASSAMVDVAVRPGGLLPVAWIYAAHLALVGLVVFATRRDWFRERIVAVAALTIVAWNTLFCSYALLSVTALPALAGPSIVLVTATALLLPWGARVQMVVATVLVLTYAGVVATAGRPITPGTLYALISLLAAGVVSSVGAYVVAQHMGLIEKQTETLREMNRVMREAGVKKDEFLAAVSHELRTPLNVVLGYIDLLLDHSFGPLEPPQRDILHRITKNASNLSHLINDLIDLSRLEAGRLKVEVQTVDLVPLFSDLVGVMEVLLAGHDVTFVSHLAPDCGRVTADPDRLKQIVSNLLVNAVKFTERGAITLRGERGADGTVAISVTDTGIGIPPSAQQAIFEPFRQIHDRSRRVPGAGIGLSISARLAQLMGGRVEVTSEPGKGSRFTLVLSALDAAQGVRKVS